MSKLTACRLVNGLRAKQRPAGKSSAYGRVNSLLAKQRPTGELTASGLEAVLVWTPPINWPILAQPLRIRFIRRQASKGRTRFVFERLFQ